jgi:hypothetical protein
VGHRGAAVTIFKRGGGTVRRPAGFTAAARAKRGSRPSHGACSRSFCLGRGGSGWGGHVRPLTPVAENDATKSGTTKSDPAIPIPTPSPVASRPLACREISSLRVLTSFAPSTRRTNPGTNASTPRPSSLSQPQNR